MTIIFKKKKTAAHRLFKGGILPFRPIQISSIKDAKMQQCNVHPSLFQPALHSTHPGLGSEWGWEGSCLSRLFSVGTRKKDLDSWICIANVGAVTLGFWEVMGTDQLRRPPLWYIDKNVITSGKVSLCVEDDLFRSGSPTMPELRGWGLNKESPFTPMQSHACARVITNYKGIRPIIIMIAFQRSLPASGAQVLLSFPAALPARTTRKVLVTDDQTSQGLHVTAVGKQVATKGKLEK